MGRLGYSLRGRRGFRAGWKHNNKEAYIGREKAV